MKHVVIDAEGFPSAFYDPAIHGEDVPSSAIQIGEDIWRELIENPGRRRLIEGNLVPYDPSPPAPTQDDYRRAIQARIDETARVRRYDSGASCASYAASTVPAWAAEAQAFIAWRDAVWAYAYAELARVEAGERPQPTVDEFLAELPTITWPG